MHLARGDRKVQWQAGERLLEMPRTLLGYPGIFSILLLEHVTYFLGGVLVWTRPVAPCLRGEFVQNRNSLFTRNPPCFWSGAPQVLTWFSVQWSRHVTAF